MNCGAVNAARNYNPVAFSGRTQRRGLAEPVVNALVGRLAHVVFCLRGGREGSVGEHGVQAGVKVDVALPCP